MLLDWAESTDTEFLGFDAQNFLANAMKAGGGILDAFNGMSTSVWYSTGQHSAR